MRSKGWLWFFVVLVVLAVLVASSLLLYNLKRQLKPENLQAARQRWQEHGPRDYRLVYTIKKDQKPPDYYAVRVRAGHAESATINGRQAPSEQLPSLDMNGLFAVIERHLEEKARPDSPRTFIRAVFDPEDGHVRSYIHSPRGGTRLEITVESLTPAAP